MPQYSKLLFCLHVDKNNDEVLVAEINAVYREFFGQVGQNVSGSIVNHGLFSSSGLASTGRSSTTRLSDSSVTSITGTMLTSK